MIRAFVGTILGAFAAFFAMAWIVRYAKPSTTDIECAWCGEKTPRVEGGIGVYNQAMREHHLICRNSPAYHLRRDMARVYELAFRAAPEACADGPERQVLSDICTIALEYR